MRPRLSQRSTSPLMFVSVLNTRTAVSHPYVGQNFPAQRSEFPVLGGLCRCSQTPYPYDAYSHSSLFLLSDQSIGNRVGSCPCHRIGREPSFFSGNEGMDRSSGQIRIAPYSSIVAPRTWTSHRSPSSRSLGEGCFRVRGPISVSFDSASTSDSVVSTVGSLPSCTSMETLASAITR